MMDQRAIEALTQIIETGPRPFDIFEWGTGGSTIWFAQKRAGRVVTVDHNQEWHRRISETALAQNLPVEALLRPAKPQPGCDHSGGHTWAMPGYDFSDYVSAITDRYNLILVDGRARVMCFQAALGHLRPGGYLVLHDAERDRYKPCRVFASQAGLAIREIVEARSLLICH